MAIIVCKQCKKKVNKVRKTFKYCSYACYWKFLTGKPNLHPREKGKYPAWNKGLIWKERWDKNHFAYKGEKVSYRNLHRWVERRLGKANCCKECGLNKLPEGKKRFFHWANISKTYKRDLKDWKMMCAKCHKKFDKHL